MRCSVVFGVTLRLLVTNISLSSPAINTATYYQRCVITCEMVAIHRRLRIQHLPVAALTQAVKPDIGSESRFLPIPHLHSTSPLGGFPSKYCYAVWHGKTRMAWLPDGEKFWWYVYSFWHDPRTWQTHWQTDGPTDGQTPHDDIASSGKKSDFHEILYTAAYFELDDRHVIKNEKVALDRLRVRQNVFLVTLTVVTSLPRQLIWISARKL